MSAWAVARTESDRGRLATLAAVAAAILGTLVLGLAMAVICYDVFEPRMPMPGLDPSWLVVLGEASAEGMRFGRDIIFTYGPAAPLGTLYLNHDYFRITLPVLLATNFVYGAAVMLLIGQGRFDRGGERALRILAAVLVCIVCTVSLGEALDPGYYALFLTLFLLDVSAPPRAPAARGLVGLGSVLAGFLCLAKGSYLVCAVLLLAIGDVRAVLARRLPFRLPLAAVGLVAGELLYRQHLSDLPAFLAHAAETISGYSEAMSVNGMRWELILYVVMAVATVVAVLRRAAIDPRNRRWVALGLAGFFFLVFKAGFVRHDGHSLASWATLGMVLPVLGFSLLWPRRFAGPAAVGAGLLVALLVFPYVLARVGGGGSADVPVLLGTAWLDRAPHVVNASVEALGDWRAFKLRAKQAKIDAMQKIRTEQPFPPLAGRVDTIPSFQSSLIANGLDYAPRPSFQEYATYAPGLIEANRAFVTGPSKPDRIIFLPGSIDDRYPSMAEGSLWPDLISLYEPEQSIEDSLVLKQRPQPLALHSGTPIVRHAPLGVAIPVDGGSLLFAHVDVRLNAAGQALKLLFRPPQLLLVAKFRDGSERPFRFIPSLGRAGFLLSPMVDDSTVFSRIAHGETITEDSLTVTEIRIVCSRGAEYLFQAEVDVTLTPLVVPPA